MDDHDHHWMIMIMTIITLMITLMIIAIRIRIMECDRDHAHSKERERLINQYTMIVSDWSYVGWMIMMITIAWSSLTVTTRIHQDGAHAHHELHALSMMTQSRAQ